MGAEELFQLADDFGKAGMQIGRALYDTFSEQGDEFAKDWAQIATGTAGKHGKHYPKAITSEAKLGASINVETGPETGKDQGGMGPGFEFGSKNQPPHLDGLNALGPATERTAKAAAKTIDDLLP